MHVFRQTVRALLRSPAESALAAATMAIAIGANTAIFSVVYATVLKPLPYPDPAALVTVTTEFGSLQLKGMGLSGPEVMELQRFTRSWSHVGSVRYETDALGGQEPRRVSVGMATPGLMNALGVSAALGRTFTADDQRGLNGQVVILSHGVWERVFGADPDVLGRRIDLGGEGRTVVGIMPRGFDLLGSETDVWLPLDLNPASPGPRADHTFRVVARLAPGVSIDQARADVDAAVSQWLVNSGELHSPAPRFHPLTITPLHEAAVGDLGKTMMILLGAVGFVLLLACANVANLLIARAEGARHQLAIRVALGASRRRLLIDQLAEGLSLAAVGCVCGLALAFVLARTLVASAPMLPQQQANPIDLVVLTFAIVVSALSGVLSGLAPLLRLDARRAHAWLQADSRGMSGSRDRRALQRVIMATQVALAMTLLAGAGVLLKSFWNLARVDPGIRAEHVVTFQLSLPERRFAADSDVWSVYERLLERLRGLPGVRDTAAMSGRLPQRRANNTTFLIEGVPVQGHEGMPQVDFIQHVTPDYFQTLGITLLIGRLLAATDTERSEPVAVVNATLARKFWAGKDPLGQRFRPVLPDNPWVTVVGVVSDVKHAGLSAPVGTEVYVTHRQARLLLSGWLPSSMHVVIRTDPRHTGAVVRAIPALTRDVNSQVAIAGLRSMSDSLGASIAGPAFVATLLASFALLALILATVGIYGVIACGVAQRTSEFGVRMVLGATPDAVLTLVLRQSAVPIAAGVAVGLAGALWASQLLATLVFQVSPADPATLGLAAVLLSAAAFIACWIPARRATRVDPLHALRTL